MVSKLIIRRDFAALVMCCLFILITSCVTEEARSVPEADAKSAENPPAVTLDGVDLYGSKRITLEMVKQTHGALLQKCLDDSIRGDNVAFQKDQQALSNELVKQYNLVFAQLTVTKYFNLHNIPGRQAYATIDVVEQADAQRRMSFLTRPHGQYVDPDGLLKAWDEYQKIGFQLMQSGEISGMRVECPAFHCIFGHDHPRLAPFKDVFVSRVAKHKDDLVRIFLGDERDEARATSAFLLAYMKDGNELVKVLSKRLYDTNKDVRNNVTRVFSNISQFHRDIAIPVDRIVPMLDFPETTDRNKASAVIFGVVNDKLQLEKYRQVIMKDAVPILLQMLRLEQPNNHDFAYMIFRALSGKEYGERDYAAWEEWYRSQQKL